MFEYGTGRFCGYDLFSAQRNVSQSAVHNPSAGGLKNETSDVFSNPNEGTILWM